ncbi:unnamed protein product [Somion occarium]|uniref:Uncharacterized protein n=1 Tax=Somion occarium TaxID=3059160 RepID=A0ABP1EC45_9APHY
MTLYVSVFELLPATVREITFDRPDAILCDLGPVWRPLDPLQSRCPQLERVTVERVCLKHSNIAVCDRPEGVLMVWPNPMRTMFCERMPTLNAKGILDFPASDDL